nr:uncharacterized protein LOC127492377 [Oryctolagus cuniculus]
MNSLRSSGFQAPDVTNLQGKPSPEGGASPPRWLQARPRSHAAQEATPANPREDTSPARPQIQPPPQLGEQGPPPQGGGPQLSLKHLTLHGYRHAGRERGTPKSECACAEARMVRSFSLRYRAFVPHLSFSPPPRRTSQRLTSKANNHSPAPREPLEKGEGGEEGGKRTEGAGLRAGSSHSPNQKALGRGGAGLQRGGGVGLGGKSWKAAGREGGLPEIKSSQSEHAGFFRRAAWGVAAAAARAGGWLRP